jgi:hypothetical protein
MRNLLISSFALLSLASGASASSTDAGDNLIIFPVLTDVTPG